MNGSSNTWWEDPQPDWTSGEPARLVDLLIRAYGELSAIQEIAGPLDLFPEEVPAGEPARDTWIRLLMAAAGRQRVLDLAAAVLHDAGSVAFHAPLRALLGDQVPEAAARLIAYPQAAEGSKREFENLVEVASQHSDETAGRLEGITDPTTGMLAADAPERVIATARRRTALIEIAGRPAGTGFLVGQDLLVTAAHVIDPRNFPPNPQPQARAVFDYEPQGQPPAETGVRVPVVDFLMASLPTEAEVTGNVTDWNAPPDSLDFALLKLKYAVPDHPDAGARGAYAPDATAYDFTARQLFVIVQQPLGDYQKVDYILDQPECNRLGTRIRYKGNTLPGSSGSPIIDARGRLVALHHYFGRGKNQAVPFSMIASKVLDEQADLFEQAPDEQVAPARAVVDPFKATELMGQPFVNRADLRGKVEEMARGDQTCRTLAITGVSGSGVSYSYKLATHVAKRSEAYPQLKAIAPGGLIAIKIDLRDYIATTVEDRRPRIAANLLVRLGVQHSPDPLAQEACDITMLSTSVAAALEKSDRQWWVFIDSIDDVVAIKHGDVHELIRVLMILAEDDQLGLRVVLAGREAEQFAREHTDWLMQDRAVGLVREDVNRWLRDRAKEDGRTVDEVRLRSKLATLFPADAPVPEPRRLAPQLPKAMLEISDEASNGS